MADGENRRILCSACGVPAQAVMSGDQSNGIRCPNCGNEADLKQVMAEAATFHARSLISKTLAGARSKNVKVKSKPNPKPRFVLG